MLFLLVGRLRLYASLGAFSDCWRLHRDARDHRFLVAERHTLLVSLCRPHPPDAHLLLEEKASLDDEHFFDNWNDNGVALFSERRDRINLLANWRSFDFNRLPMEQFVDQLLALMCNPRDLDASGFDYLLR